MERVSHLHRSGNLKSRTDYFLIK